MHLAAVPAESVEAVGAQRHEAAAQADGDVDVDGEGVDQALLGGVRVFRSGRLGRRLPHAGAAGDADVIVAGGINDGAAAMVVMSAEKAKELGSPRWRGSSAARTADVRSEVKGIAPVYSTEKALKAAVGKMLELDESRVNVNGGQGVSTIVEAV